MPATAPPPPSQPASDVLAWLAWLLALSLAALLAPALFKVEPALLAAGPVGGVILGLLAVVGAERFSPWSAALWAMLALMACIARLADASPDPILGVSPESALVTLLGVVYAVAAIYVLYCPLLDVRMKGVLLVLAVWGSCAVPIGLARGLTLWDLVQRKANPLAGSVAIPYLDPTFVGVNAFLICVLAAGLFDLFSRLILRDWKHAGAVMVLVLTLFAGERYLLDRYDARGLPNFRTVVREAVRVQPDARGGAH